MKAIAHGLIETTKSGLQKVNNTVDAGLETAEKVFLTIGSVVLAGTALGILGPWLVGQLGLLPSN